MLISLVQEYTSYIDERILWIRSIPEFRWSDLVAIPTGLHWLTSPASWHELVKTLAGEIRRKALLHLAIGLLLIVCFAYRSHGVREIQRFGEQAAAKGCRNFGVTLKTFLWTFAVSAAGPALLSWLAWTLYCVAKDEGTEFARPFASAAQHAAIAYWPFSFWMNTLRRSGLAESAFSMVANRPQIHPPPAQLVCADHGCTDGQLPSVQSTG